MLSMQTKIPRVKKAGHLLPVLPLIPHKTTSMEEEKGEYIAFELKTRVGQPSESTKYKKIFMVYKLQLEQVSGSSGIRTHDGTEKMIFCTTTAIAGCW